MKVANFSAPHTGRLYPPGNILGVHFSYRLIRPQGHSAAGRIMSMKNSNDTIGNRTRDFSLCSVVPQPTEPLLASLTTTRWPKTYFYTAYTWDGTKMTWTSAEGKNSGCSLRTSSRQKKEAFSFVWLWSSRILMYHVTVTFKTTWP